MKASSDDLPLSSVLLFPLTLVVLNPPSPPFRPMEVSR